MTPKWRGKRSRQPAAAPDDIREYVKQLRLAYALLGGLLLILVAATADRLSLRGDLERFEERVLAERLLAKEGVNVVIDPKLGFPVYDKMSANTRVLFRIRRQCACCIWAVQPS